MSDEEDALLSGEKDQDQIRAELAQMSFEDLQKLKEKLGTKVYNATVFGAKRITKVDFTRKNKNRPREMSAKIPVPRFKEVVHVKKNVPRDPRFDSLCGTFNEKAFKHSYAFLSKYRQNDLKRLKSELKKTEDPKAIKKIKYLMQRLKNQLREEKTQKQKEEKKMEEKKEIVQAIKQGEKPVFKKKSERKILDLVSKYEELKNTGKLKKHIERLRKKNLHKDRAKLATTEIE